MLGLLVWLRGEGGAATGNPSQPLDTHGFEFIPFYPLPLNGQYLNVLTWETQMVVAVLHRFSY